MRSLPSPLSHVLSSGSSQQRSAASHQHKTLQGFHLSGQPKLTQHWTLLELLLQLKHSCLCLRKRNEQTFDFDETNGIMKEKNRVKDLHMSFYVHQ